VKHALSMTEMVLSGMIVKDWKCFCGC